MTRNENNSREGEFYYNVLDQDTSFLLLDSLPHDLLADTST